MNQTNAPTIDSAACVGCGQCVLVCPRRVLALGDDDKAMVRSDRCFHCGHCQAACPVQAVTVPQLDPQTYEFKTFSAESKWTKYGEGDTAELVRLMASRRSTRHFAKKPVNDDLLEDLCKIGITAPTGTNCQPWHFTIVHGDGLDAYRAAISATFERLNAQAEKGWLRGLLKLLGKPQLADYYRVYYPLVRSALGLWKDKGIDLLFHNAPAAIVISCRDSASTPAEDALLAAQNMQLAAHTSGLGTCLIGFAVAAMRRDPAIAKTLKIPAGHATHAVLALGHPDETYQQTILRQPISLHWFSGSEQR